MGAGEHAQLSCSACQAYRCCEGAPVHTLCSSVSHCALVSGSAPIWLTGLTVQQPCQRITASFLAPRPLSAAGLDIFGTLPASEENLAAVEEICLQVSGYIGGATET